MGKTNRMPNLNDFLKTTFRIRKTENLLAKDNIQMIYKKIDTMPMSEIKNAFDAIQSHREKFMKTYDNTDHKYTLEIMKRLSEKIKKSGI